MNAATVRCIFRTKVLAAAGNQSSHHLTFNRIHDSVGRYCAQSFDFHSNVDHPIRRIWMITNELLCLVDLLKESRSGPRIEPRIIDDLRSQKIRLTLGLEWILQNHRTSRKSSTYLQKNFCDGLAAHCADC